MTLNGVMALFCVISVNLVVFGAHCVKVHVHYLTPYELLLFLLNVLLQVRAIHMVDKTKMAFAKKFFSLLNKNH